MANNKINIEIYVMQTTIKNAIPKLSFSKLVREIMQERNSEMKIQLNAMEALQTAAEMYVVQHLHDSYLCTKHARRITLRPDDMALSLVLQNDQ